MELAIYGAIVATLGVAFHFFRLNRERPTLRVHAHPCWADGVYVRGGTGFSYLSFEVLNTGRVPIVLSGVGSASQRKEPLPSGAGGSLSSSLLAGDGLPRQLDPGHCYRGLSQIPTEVLEGEHALTEIWAEDSLGRRYKVAQPRLNRVRSEISDSRRRSRVA